jgi:hypothetical protein
LYYKFITIPTNQIQINFKYGGKAKFEVLYDKHSVHGVCIGLMCSSKHKALIIIIIIIIIIIMVVVVVVVVWWW